uniref:BTB domain-containing protein n=1 Tax=Glossina brevipalpis TaxID=37001 RepID=A0A1A9W0K6_9MUSC
MISLSALLTTLGVMNNNQANNVSNQAAASINNNAGPNANPAAIPAAVGVNNQNSAAEGSMERGSCLLRYASQNSLDESSQKHIQRPNSKDRTVGQYHNELHSARSFEAMNEMRKQNLLCDVTLVADDMEIPAHKMVLASCSPYFYAMFTGFEESRQGRITLQGVDHHALELLIEYVYTSTVEVNEDNVQVLLTAANLLQLTDVRDACCDYLQTQLDASNCLGIRDFADMHGCVELVNYAETYIEQHFNEVIQFDEFLNLTHEQVISLISNDRISVSSEEKVYECVINWIRYDHTLREQYTADLMEHVRLPFLSKEYITQKVDKEPLLEGNIICKNLIIEALTYHLLPNEIKTVRTIPRKPVGLPKILLVIGGQAPKAIRSVECYDLREEKWYQAAEMPNRRCRAGLAVLGDKVYAVGGFNGSLRVRTVDVYDPATDQWSTSNSMEARRSTLGVAVLNGCIYAVGGFDGTTGLCSAEMFDPKNEVWRFIASMSTRRSSVGVGVVNGLLYAVGGYDGYTRQCLSSVERYNPEADAWQAVADMSARRSGAGVGVLNNILYAVGGHDGPMVRKSVEAYDPESNQWHSVADMSFCRRNAGVVAHDGLLYVVGGDDGDSNLSSVEVYSPETDSWRILAAAMIIGRSYAGVCMIDKPIQVAANIMGIVDDENSQAEGTIEGAVGLVRNNEQHQQPQANIANSNSNNTNCNQQQQINHPHYENIYETIEQYNAAARGGAVSGVVAVPAVSVAASVNASNSVNAPAEEQQQLQSIPQQQQQQPQGNDNNAQTQQQQQSRLYNSINYRNDLYDRANASNIGSTTSTNTTTSSGGNNYDIPRSVRSALGFRRNFQLDLHAANPRFNTLRCNGISCGHNALHNVYGSSTSCQRQHSFDDSESQNYFNLNNYPAPTMRYENIYEQIRDEPIYRNTTSTTSNSARLYGRLNVIGHGIGRIERHLSSSCGNIDHYNLGGHYAVLGHSHFGTVGHIRLNAGSNNGVNGGSSSASVNTGSTLSSGGSALTASNSKDAGNVRNSASSFFSCLHGESTQSMNNIYKASANVTQTSNVNGSNGQSVQPTVTPNSSKERESRASSVGPLLSTNVTNLSETNTSTTLHKATGAIPKIKALNLGSTKSSISGSSSSSSAEKSVATLKNALSKKSATSSANANPNKLTTATNTFNTMTMEPGNSTLNRISKSSLQWLLVNKWLPLWIGQGTDCKVIDFNFMFSRDCVDCDAASATAQMSNPYATPRLSGLPQDIVRFNARAMCCNATPNQMSFRRQNSDLNNRPVHSTLNRLRETETFVNSRRYEDPSYENVHVQWQNGFEFGRSRDQEHNAICGQNPTASYAITPVNRNTLQRTKCDSPNLNQRVSNNAASNQQKRLRTNTNSSSSSNSSSSNSKFKDPYRTYELNTENNTFKPKSNQNLKCDTLMDNNSSESTNKAVDANIGKLPEELEGAVGGTNPSPLPSAEESGTQLNLLEANITSVSPPLPIVNDVEPETKTALPKGSASEQKDN